jgi:hypothetical protein
MMFTREFAVLALVAAPFVAAHGKIPQVVGDAGGNGTALGIKGAVIAGSGSNGNTEKDTTVFNSQNIRANGDWGKTTIDGQLKPQVASLATNARALSGGSMPLVTAGGHINATWLAVTSDGCGPLEAIVDESAAGQFASALSTQVTTGMPGVAGECPASTNSGQNKVSGPAQTIALTTRSVLVKMGLLSKRAQNTNKDFVSSPPGRILLPVIWGA